MNVSRRKWCLLKENIEGKRTTYLKKDTTYL